MSATVPSYGSVDDIPQLGTGSPTHPLMQVDSGDPRFPDPGDLDVSFSTAEKQTALGKANNRLYIRIGGYFDKVPESVLDDLANTYASYWLFRMLTHPASSRSGAVSDADEMDDYALAYKEQFDEDISDLLDSDLDDTQDIDQDRSQSTISTSVI